MKVFQNPTGNSAEDEQNNKRHARRIRVYLIIAAVFVAFLVILITVLTPMLVLQKEESNTNNEYGAVETSLANNFTTEFRDAVLNAISAVYGVQGYIMGEMTSLPNLTGSVEERVLGQYFPTFDRYASLISSSAPSVAVFVTAPGAVTYQFYPEVYGDDLRGWDLLNRTGYGPGGHWSDPASGRPPSWTSIGSGRLSITGPYNTTGLPFVEKPTTDHNDPAGRPEHVVWWIDLRQPVYAATANAQVSARNYWGFALAALNIEHLLEDRRFAATMEENHMNYAVFTTRGDDECLIIRSSWPDQTDCATPFMRDFIDAATVHDVLGDQLAWKVAIRSRLRVTRLSKPVSTAIVVSSVLGSAVLFVLVLYAIILCTRVYDGTIHAPKMAPFAMLTVGPCRGEELWELASDQMVEARDRLGRVLARQMVRHRAYQIQQVHPLTMSYVTRSVAAAVQMAFDTIEELQSAPIDDALRRLLGDDGCLLLSYAVHWCSDATVRPEHVGGGYHYEGPDIVYGGRLWVFAAPNVVTVSPPALAAAKKIPHVHHQLFDSVFLRGVTQRQDLYVVWDPSNPKLREAEAFAAEQVRRARQAQREAAALKVSESDTHQRRLTYTYNATGYESSDMDMGSFAARPRRHSSESSRRNHRGRDTHHDDYQHPLPPQLPHPSHPHGSSGRGTSSTSNSTGPNDSSSTPPSAMRSRATAAKVLRRDGSGVAAAAAAKVAVIVPPSSPDAPLTRAVAAAAAAAAVPAGVVMNPLVLHTAISRASESSASTSTAASQTQGRRMVRRASFCTGSSSTTTGGSRSSSSDGGGGSERECHDHGNKLSESFGEGHAVDARAPEEAAAAVLVASHSPKLTARVAVSVPCGGCAPPLPALPPINAHPQRPSPAPQTVVPPTLPTTASTPGGAAAGLGGERAVPFPSTPLPPTALSSRRVLDGLFNAGVAVTSPVASAPRHGDPAAAKPLVVVPPSAELAAATASGSGVGAGSTGVGAAGGGAVGGVAAGAGGPLSRHVVSSKTVSGTTPSDSASHSRRGTAGPYGAYDNPLAHHVATGTAVSVAGPAVSGYDSVTGTLVSPSAPLVAMAPFASDGDPLADSRVSLDHFSSDLLLRPAITVQADHLLRTVFDRQAVALDVSYDSVRVLVYYFYSSYKILFRPLAAPERHNIYRRLVTAFGVPQQGILEHLAARCAIRFLQRHEETQTLLWDQQRRLQVHARSSSGGTVTTSEEANGSHTT